MTKLGRQVVDREFAVVQCGIAQDNETFAAEASRRILKRHPDVIDRPHGRSGTTVPTAAVMGVPPTIAGDPGMQSLASFGDPETMVLECGRARDEAPVFDGPYDLGIRIRCRVPAMSQTTQRTAVDR